jgi:rfaE bifunctional protein kinase chain/domain
VWGTVTRISPEAPVPVVEVRDRSFVAGGAANTATNVAALGGRPFLAGLVGDDAAGETACDLLRTAGVDVGPLVRDRRRPTTTKTRILAQSQQVVRIDTESRGAIPADLEDALMARIGAVLPVVRGCVLSDYGKGVVTPRFAQELIRRCREASVPVVVDPKGTDYHKYRGATVVKPNQFEAGNVLNRDLRDAVAVRDAGRELLDLLGPDAAVLITQGPHGMTLFERGRPPVHVPTAAREVFDVTGAGDTVAGTLGLSLAVGGSLEAGCRLATAAAAVVVGKKGTATVTADELFAATTPLRAAA